MGVYSFAVDVVEDRILPSAYATAGLLAGATLGALEAYKEFIEPHVPDTSRLPLIKYFQAWVPHDLVNRLEKTLTRRPPGLESVEREDTEDFKPASSNGYVPTESKGPVHQEKAVAKTAVAAAAGGPEYAGETASVGAAKMRPATAAAAKPVDEPQINGTANKRDAADLATPAEKDTELLSSTEAATPAEESTLPLSTKSGGKTGENGAVAASPTSSEDFSTDADATAAEEQVPAATVESNGVYKASMKEVSKPKTTMTEASQRKKKSGSRKAAS